MESLDILFQGFHHIQTLKSLPVPPSPHFQDWSTHKLYPSWISSVQNIVYFLLHFSCSFLFPLFTILWCLSLVTGDYPGLSSPHTRVVELLPLLFCYVHPIQLYNFTSVHGLTFSEGNLVQLILDIDRTLGILLSLLPLLTCDVVGCPGDALDGGNVPGGNIPLYRLRVPSQRHVPVVFETPLGWLGPGGLQESGPCCAVAPPGAHALSVGVLPRLRCVDLVLFLLSSRRATFPDFIKGFQTLHGPVALVVLVVGVHVGQVHLLVLHRASTGSISTTQGSCRGTCKERICTI